MPGRQLGVRACYGKNVHCRIREAEHSRCDAVSRCHGSREVPERQIVCVWRSEGAFLKVYVSISRWIGGSKYECVWWMSGWMVAVVVVLLL
jgi:hypothetical protein